MGRAKNTGVLLRVKDRGFMVAVIGVIPTTGQSRRYQPPSSPFYFQPLPQQRSTLTGIGLGFFENDKSSLIVNEYILRLIKIRFQPLFS